MMLRLPYTLEKIPLTRFVSTTSYLSKNRAGKTRSTPNQTQMLTYEMAQKPHHLGSRKAWLSWHTHNLEEFRKAQGSILAQDEVIRRFIRGFFPGNVPFSGNELVIKRRGNSIAIAGFFIYNRVTVNIGEIYWKFGFIEEFLSILLKQPVVMEIQFVKDTAELGYIYV